MLGLAALVLSAPAPPPPDLIDRLGAPAFAAREQAGRELAGYGPDALSLLSRAAHTHPDPEVRRRADDLAGRIRRLVEDAARVAAPALKLDYTRVPLNVAVADLRSRTGLPLQLDPARPVTVRTGELPPWEAVEVFLQAADLHEVVRAELPLGPLPGESLVRLRPRPPSLSPFHQDAPAAVPVVLADRYAPLPGDRGGGVRVQAVPADFPGHRVVRGAGVVHLCLDVSPLPVLAAGGRWEEVTAVRLRHAEDEQGRPVPAAHRDLAEPEPQPQTVVFGGVLLAPGLLAPPFGDVSGRPTTRPNPRLVSLALRTDDRPARRLGVLDGVVVGEVTVPNQPLVSVEDLVRAVRAGASGAGDVRLAVLGVTTDPAGRTTVRVRVDAPNPWNFPRANRAVNLGLPGFGPPLFGPATNPLPAYRFTDAAGRPVSPSGAVPGAVGDDGFRQSTELDFRFDRRDGAGPPVRLVLIGEKTVPVEVPFRLRDVPLP